MRRGFTIIELMVVIGIIAILLSLTVVSVAGSVRSARNQRSTALCTLAKQGLETYYAQKGKWPWGNDKRGEHDDGCYWLTPGEIREAFFEIVKEAKQKRNPMMDISGLFVCEYDGAPKTHYHGMDFLSAVRGTKTHKKKIPAGSLYYGYLNDDGYFRRFVIKYSPATDSITVRKYTAAEEQGGTIYDN